MHLATRYISTLYMYAGFIYTGDWRGAGGGGEGVIFCSKQLVTERREISKLTG